MTLDEQLARASAFAITLIPAMLAIAGILVLGFAVLAITAR
jgi:hypothetical protein